MLIGKHPKDFDIATSAHPKDVRGLFKNARIIGRRFQLAHILFRRDIIEVATFRGDAEKPGAQKKNDKGMIVRDNVYGTLEEDVWRRDLTINALYYDVKTSSIIDFTGGVEDIKKKQVRIIGDPTERFLEDPVRMIRAIRFSAKLDFNIEEATYQALCENTEALAHVSSSRLFEEVLKVYHSGQAQVAQQQLIDSGLFKVLFPLVNEALDADETVNDLILETLKSTDKRIQNNRPVTPAFLFATLLWRPLLNYQQSYIEKGMPPLPALEKAMKVLVSKQQQFISIPKRFIQSMREIWLLQFQLNKRHGKRAFRLATHPRFRAAYDFLLIRSFAGEVDTELAEWWTDFQRAKDDEKKRMVNELKQTNQ